MKFRGRETEYHRNYYYKRRQRLIDYLGGKCVQCGSTTDLEFDHIDPSLKSFDIKRNHTLESIKDELDKCQLLCSVCHRKKSAKENSDRQGGPTHGKDHAWRRLKCQCDLCLTAKRIWYDERNKRRRKSSTVAV